MEDARTTSTSEHTETGSQVRLRPSECKICLRPGHGHHYGVAACKGCKTFFRRVCVSNAKLNCQLSNDCFDSTKRAQLHLRCQSCRYQKCIEVGMNVRALELKEGEDQCLNYKNAAVKKNLEDTESPAVITVVPKETLQRSIINMLTYLEVRLDQFKNSAYNPSFMDWQISVEGLITCSSKLAMADRLGAMKGWPLTNQVELPKLSRMRDVPDFSHQPSPNLAPAPPPANQKMWLLFNIMTTIEYMKTFKFFHDLDIKDQTILIGHVTLVCVNLHNSYFAVSRKMDRCIHPDGVELPQRDEYHYKAFSMAIAPLIRCGIQPVEYVLLKAICLCNPTVHGLSECAQKVISIERQKYADVLLDVCLRNRTDGPKRFVELLGIISVLVHQQKLQKDIHIYHIGPIIAKFPFSVQFLDEIMNS